MAAIAHDGAPPTLLRGLWYRRLDRYPQPLQRYSYLAIVVVATILLYYELYIGGAVAPSLLHSYGISFGYYALILVFGNAFGAVASLAAGLADRWGRANLVAYGLLAAGLLTLFGIPNATSGFQYGVYFTLVSIVEGVVLVATPALIRDYSPQVGRASAMGFWTLGPVLGSLVVTEVVSHTFTDPDWQRQYRICGIAGMVVWAIAFVLLRELAPQLRDQVMVSMRDRALIEARALSLDVAAAESHQWKPVLKPQIIGSAIGISTFLAVYYTAVAFAVIYLTTVFGFTQSRSNDLLNWWWGAEAITLIAVGLLSDRLLVRKPFMLAGGIGTVVMTLVLIAVTGHTDTSYGTLALVVAGLGVFISLAFAPWMAAFTESVEGLSPAATATGLAIWGLTIRTVVSLLFLVIPHAVGSVTPIVDHGAEAQAALAAVPPSILQPVLAHQALFAELSAYPPNQVPPAVLARAVQELGGGAAALPILQGAQTYAAPLAVLAQYGPGVQQAQADAPGEWQHWFWVCVAGEIIFIPTTLILVGRWSPRRARQDEEAHERVTATALAALETAPAPTAAD